MTTLATSPRLYTVSSHLLPRYLDALRAIGLTPPTGLPATIQIDRLGWSPQVARALGRDYLWSDTSRKAIILSTDQNKVPVVRLRHSFEGEALNLVFREARPTILDIIEHEAAIVTIDLELHSCLSVYDLYRLQHVRLGIDTPTGAIGALRELVALGQQFIAERKILDTAFIRSMLALQQRGGDPRQRVLPPALTLAPRSFWSAARGITYILRDPDRGDLIISSHDDADIRRLTIPLVDLADSGSRALNELHRRGYLVYQNVEATIQRRLAEIETFVLLEAGISGPPQNPAARTRLIAATPNARALLRRQPVYEELQLLQTQLKARADTVDMGQLAPGTRWALVHAAREEEMLSDLIARFVPWDLALAARHNQARIERQWPDYSEATRAHLAERYPALVAGFVDRQLAPTR